MNLLRRYIAVAAAVAVVSAAKVVSPCYAADETVLAGGINLDKEGHVEVRIPNIPARLEVAAEAKRPRLNEGKSAAAWSVTLTDSIGNPLTVAEIGWRMEGSDLDQQTCKLTVKVFQSQEGIRGIAADKSYVEKVSVASGPNSLVWRFGEDGNVAVAVGADEFADVCDFSLSSAPASIRIDARQSMEIIEVIYSGKEPRGLGQDNLTDLTAHLTSISSGSIEGCYKYLDSDTDMSISRRGGDYRLAVIGKDDGDFDIFYIEGAAHNASAWHKGMLKGRLKASDFEGNYGLQWLDSEQRTVADGAWARISDGILELHFPYEKSVLRFSRQNTND